MTAVSGLGAPRPSVSRTSDSHTASSHSTTSRGANCAVGGDDFASLVAVHLGDEHKASTDAGAQDRSPDITGPTRGRHDPSRYRRDDDRTRSQDRCDDRPASAPAAGQRERVRQAETPHSAGAASRDDSDSSITLPAVSTAAQAPTQPEDSANAVQPAPDAADPVQAAANATIQAAISALDPAAAGAANATSEPQSAPSTSAAALAATAPGAAAAQTSPGGPGAPSNPEPQTGPEVPSNPEPQTGPATQTSPEAQPAGQAARIEASASAGAPNPTPLPIPGLPTAPVTPAATQAFQSNPAQPVASQVMPEVTALMARADGTHRIRLRLSPEALGDVSVVLTMRNGSVDVTLGAGAQARLALEQSTGELHRLLQLAGAQSTQVTVTNLADDNPSFTLTQGQVGGAGAGGAGFGGFASEFGTGRGYPQSGPRRAAGAIRPSLSAPTTGATGAPATYSHTSVDVSI